MTIKQLNKPGKFRAALMSGLVITLLASGTALAQEPSPAALSPAEPLNAPGATGAAPAPSSEPPTSAGGAVAETERNHRDRIQHPVGPGSRT